MRPITSTQAELARLQGQVAGGGFVVFKPRTSFSPVFVIAELSWSFTAPSFFLVGIPTRMDDPSMLAYWQAMWTANVGDDRILDLGDAKLVNQDGENFGNTKLFVRDCYKHLSGLLMDARAAHKNVVISGTPGVGKTAFRNFFVFHLVQRMKANPTERFTIILHGTPGERSATCSVLTCSATSQLSALRVADVYQYARKDDPNIVYLVDVSKGNSDDMKIFPAGKTVMFTSPNEKAYSEFRKSGLFKSKPLYMPLWKTRELHQAAAMLGIDAESEDFTLKVERFGGVPRAVWDDPDYENSVQDALLKIDWNACTKNLGSMDNTEGVRHRFVYYKVAEHEDGTYDFTEASLYFGTDFLLACAADKYVQTTRDAVNSVMASPWPGVTPGEKGDFLEAVAHRSLCLCTEVDIRRLGHTSTLLYNSTPFRLAPALRAPLEWTWFDDVDEAVRLLNDALTTSKTAYLRPRSDKFPALDAILVTCERKVMLLQVTISERHHITGPQAVETLGTFVGVCETNGIEPSLVFFVPPTQFSTYPRQTLQGELQSTVKQYVISLRSTGAFQPNPPPAGEVPVTSSSSSRTPCAVAAADVENSTLKRKPQGDAEF